MLEKLLKSSHDPEKVSLTVKGTLMNVVGIIVMFGGSAVPGGELTDIVEVLAMIAGTAVVLLGQGQVVYGLIRKLWAK